MPRDEATLADALRADLRSRHQARLVEAAARRRATPSGRRIADVIQRNDPHCRGVLVLGLEASEEDLDKSFRIAAPHADLPRLRRRPLDLRRRRGTLVRRPAWATTQVIADIAGRYARLIARWDEARAGVAEAVNR